MISFTFMSKIVCLETLKRRPTIIKQRKSQSSSLKYPLAEGVG